MAENSTPEQKTEMPTERRMGQIRNEGQLFISTDVVQILSLMLGFIILEKFVGQVGQALMVIFDASFRAVARRDPLSIEFLYQGFIYVVRQLGPVLLIICASAGIAAALAVAGQTKFNKREKLFRFQMNFLNPIEGVKRIFSISNLFNIIKQVAKLLIIGPVAYFTFKEFAPQMVQLMHLTVPALLHYTANAVDVIFWKIAAILFVIAIIDYFWGRHKWLENIKMTKDEVKDERKSVEGDESTRRKIQAKGWSRIIQRIKKSVPTADVVVTNPTHYAVALKYDRGRMRAPTVVAKGTDHTALKIREIAREAGVPIVERRTLARALYSSVRVGAEIPFELYKAVAEVLAFVYRIRNRVTEARAT